MAQKGSDILATAIPKLLKSDISLVVAGSGDPGLMTKLEGALSKTRERSAFLGGVPETIIHRLLAAADIMVVPSRFEPCGLVQLYAQRYGAIPVVTRTGGLVDTVIDCDAELETGSGFLFDEPTPSPW